MMKIKGYGKEYTVEAKKGMYQNGNLCIQLFCLNEEFGYMEPYARLTVNLQDGLTSDLAYVDTNNVPNAEDFINTYDERQAEYQKELAKAGREYSPVAFVQHLEQIWNED